MLFDILYIYIYIYIHIYICDPLREQFQICIRHLESGQSVNSQVNLKILFGASFSNFAQILQKKQTIIDVLECPKYAFRYP